MEGTPFHSRRRPAPNPPRRRQFDPEIVYVTACAKGRKCIFDNTDVHELLVSVWREATDWLVGGYVLMPDHVHLLCTPASTESGSLERWIRFWKSMASSRWPRPEEHPIWQDGAFTRKLRSDDSYREKCIYVRRNPVRARFVTTPEQWPYSGEIHRFRF